MKFRFRYRYPIEVPGLFVAGAILGLVLGWAGLFAFVLGEERVAYMLLSFEFAFTIPLAVTAASGALAAERVRVVMQKCPKTVQVEPGPDGNLVALVTTQAGDFFSLPLPEGYDPHDDGGRWLMEHVVPEELRDSIRQAPDAGEDES